MNATVPAQRVTKRQSRFGPASKTYGVVVLFLTLRAVGNSTMAWGMKHVPERMNMNPVLYARAALNPFVAMGIVALILALLTRMALFSLADLSFVLPVTSLGYVIAVVIGKTFLHETVSRQRWIGTLLILGGAVLVGSTAQNTTSEDDSP